jgi:hypothetical protein
MMAALPETTTTTTQAATMTQAQLDQLVVGIKQSFAEERRRKEAGIAATLRATLTPREHVTAMIEHLAAKSWQGEHILQMIERHIAGYSPEDKKLAFGTSRLLTDADFVGEAP